MHVSVVSKKSYERKETLLVPIAADQNVTSKLNDTDKSFLDSYVRETSFARKDTALLRVPELGIGVLLCGIVSLTDSLAAAIRGYAGRIDTLVFDLDMFAQFSLSDESLVNAIASAVLLGSDPGRRGEPARLRSVVVNVAEERVEAYRQHFNRAIENVTATLEARGWGNRLAASLSIADAAEGLRKGLSKRVKSKELSLKDLKTARLSGLAGAAIYGGEEPELLVLEHKPEKGKTIVVCGACLIDVTRQPSERERDAIPAAVVRSLAEIHSVYEKDTPVVFLIALARYDPARAPASERVRLASGASYDVESFGHLAIALLADTLYYASRYKPRLVVSLGSDGVSTMLGKRIMTFVSNADVLKSRLEDAGRFVYERVWELPLVSLHAVQGVKRTVALRSLEPNAAFSNVTSLELSTAGYPWTHLDLSAYATASRARGLQSVGSTGFGAATMTEYLRRLSS